MTKDKKTKQLEQTEQPTLGTIVHDIWEDIDDDVKTPNHVLPDPELLGYYVLAQDRKLELDSDVEDLSECIWENVLRWNMEDKGLPREARKPITIYVMSDGGAVDHMWMLVDVLMASTTPIITVNIGVAASAAALVFLAGDKRLMTKNAQIMLHEGSAALRGDASKVLDAAENYNRDLKRMRDFVLERTKIAPEEMEKHHKDDWYISAEDCLKYGVCDQIVESLEEII